MPQADLLLALIFWVALWGTLGALVAPRKGYPPSYGFGVAGVLGILGLAYLALKPDAAAPRATTPRPGEVIRRYSGRTRPEAEAAYHADLPAAQWAGYEPYRRYWPMVTGDPVLEVTYRLTP